MLALLVVVSVVLLTAYFGESSSSPLHSVQRGIVAVVTPIQDGASKVLSPVRDVSDWVSTTLRSKTENAQLRKENARLTTELAVAQQKAIDDGQLTREVKLDEDIGASGYDPVAAAVIGRDPSLWNQQVLVNAGSGDGVAVGDPVIGDGALIGKVSLVTGSSAWVVLITDHTVGVAAEVQDGGGAAGILEPAVGNPSQLLLTELDPKATVKGGDLVVTAGFKDPSDPSKSGSLYPPGIPIGHVAAFSQNDLLNSGQVPVTPYAQLRQFTSVQVLTKPLGANVAALVK